MARPRIEIDIAKVEEYAGQGLTQEEIALCLGISERTLRNHKQIDSVISDAIKRGRAVAAAAVSNKLFDMATGGDLGAIIWYEKTRRGLSDRQAIEHTGREGAPIEVRQFDYTAAAAKIAAGSGEDSDASGED